MKEYIEREAAIHAVVKSFWSKPYISDVELAQAVRDVDTAEVGLERKRGEWIEVSYWKYKNGHSIRYTAKRCSVCGADVGKKTQYNGCPYCFADMRGEKHEP